MIARPFTNGTVLRCRLQQRTVASSTEHHSFDSTTPDAPPGKQVIQEQRYAASKHAVIGLTKVLALELAKYNIRVNAICPGYADTPMLRRIFGELAKIEKKSEEQVIKEIIATIPVGRLGTPEDIGKVVAFLASDDAEYVTGQSISVCGGLEMH